MFDLYASWFKTLQENICHTIEDIDSEMESHEPTGKEGWTQRHMTLRGDVFEKATVNFSKIESEFDPSFAHEIPGTEEHNRYQATGISVVLHPWNPHAPAMHFNTRYLKTSTKEWFGGGMDVTPSFSDKKEKILVHQRLKAVCERNNKNYNKYKKWCDKYFYLPHRKESRGIGGIFFDYETKDWEKNFKFVQDLGITFIEITKKIILGKKKLNWNDKDKEQQLYKRGRYVEFNLLYDRGTKFGLNSGGNTESILMSLPPQAKWK